METQVFCFIEKMLVILRQWAYNKTSFAGKNKL